MGPFKVDQFLQLFMSFSQHLRNSTANTFHVCIPLSHPREGISLSAQSNEDTDGGVDLKTLY